MLNELIEKFKTFEECKEYTSRSGKKCYIIYGDLSYLFYLCYRYNIEINWINDNEFQAKGNGFELKYCENSIILAID